MDARRASNTYSNDAFEGDPERGAALRVRRAVGERFIEGQLAWPCFDRPIAADPLFEFDGTLHTGVHGGYDAAEGPSGCCTRARVRPPGLAQKVRVCGAYAVTVQRPASKFQLLSNASVRGRRALEEGLLSPFTGRYLPHVLEVKKFCI